MVKNFNLVMLTNFDSIDFPIGSISPDSKKTRNDQTGFFDAVETLIINDDTARALALVTGKAQLISSGDLNIRSGFPTGGKDEIADLARTFRVMVEEGQPAQAPRICRRTMPASKP